MKISKELQEVMAVIEELSPKWRVHNDGSSKTIAFQKEIEDGVYDIKVEFLRGDAEYQRPDSIKISVILCVGARLMESWEGCHGLEIGTKETLSIFSKKYVLGSKEFDCLSKLIEDVHSHEAELKQDREEQAQDKFYGRKTRRR